MKKLIAMVMAAGVAVSPASIFAQAEAPQGEVEQEVEATTQDNLTYDQLMGVLGSSGVPDAAVAPMVGADLAAVTEDSEIRVVPLSELEGWTGDRAELDKAIAARGVSHAELVTAIETRPHVMAKFEEAGVTPDSVLTVITPGTNTYTFYVDEPPAP